MPVWPTPVVKWMDPCKTRGFCQRDGWVNAIARNPFISPTFYTFAFINIEQFDPI